MPYIELSDLVLSTNYKAKEMSIIEFNTILAKIETFSNVCKDNLNYIHTNNNTIIYDTEEPEEAPLVNTILFQIDS